jgi:two-component system chemotaxis response regulator CheY
MIETNTDNACILKLPANLDFAAAENLLAVLKRKSADVKQVWLDASDVETLALPCVQIVLAAIKLRGAISVVKPSAAFVRAFTDIGIVWDHQPAEFPTNDVETNLEPPQTDQADTGQASEAAVSKRILTIDDSKTMRDMLMLTLSNCGYDVLQAVDGQDGINVLAKENVDVIITDINMPIMDGYQVIEHLRKNREYDSTPILVLTTESDKEKKERARGLGATGFIVKPFNPVSLVEVIRKVSP